MSARLRIVGTVVFAIVSVLAIAAIVLEQGVWTRKQELAGPFERESSPDSRAFFFHVDDHVPLSCCLEIRSDNPDRPYQSDLTLSIDGQAMGPPHTPHVYIRRGDTIGFSHWGGSVFFAPPGGARSVRAFVQYSVRPTRPALWLLVIAATSLGLVLYRNAAESFVVGRGRRVATAAIVAPYRLALGFGAAALAVTTIFVISAGYAWATGWALPTTALVQWSAIARWLARAEPQLGQILVGFAALGALGSWIALVVPGGDHMIDREEARLLRFGRLACFPLAACCLVLSLSAMWSGLVRQGDLQGLSIGGLISFSDASGYVADSYDQARDGVWNSFTLRRPIAGASRSLLLLAAGYSVPRMLVIQIVLLAAALCFAAMVVARWRGSWAALAFFGLSYTYVRSFAPTTLTEPLGLAWGFVSIALLVRSLHRESRTDGIFGIGAMAMSLMTRMGAMFALPALITWITLRRGQTQQLKTAGLTLAAVGGVLAVSFALSKAYNGGQGVTGGNFAYTVCGLTIGTSWDGCPSRLEQQGQPLPVDENESNRILYRMALDRLRANPRVLFARLADGARTFVAELPEVTWRGYQGVDLEPSWIPVALLSWLCLPATAVILYRRRSPNELAFWVWTIVAILISAPFVYFDDGRRVLATGYTFLYLFFAIGFSIPRRDVGMTAAVNASMRPWTIATVGAAAALIVAPALSHVVYTRLSPRIDTAPYLGGTKDTGQLASGQHVSGFLIVADDAPLRSDVPTLHFSDFEAIVQASGIEFYQGLIHPKAPPRPFAFVYAPQFTSLSRNDYIGPAELIERRDVKVWALEVGDWNLVKPEYVYWYNVTRATAVR